MKAWIGVDLDGTLAEYHGWRGVDHIGPPIPLMVDRVRKWIASDKEVKILTARVGPQPPDVDVGHIRSVIEEWCEEHIGVRLTVTATKDFGMTELWDDRCVQVVPNTGIALRDMFDASAD